jgi:succinate dehydrogenase hydrophobic anchor subunit
MLAKSIVLAFMALILYFLGSGAYYLIKDGSTQRRTVNSLTWRIALSIVLFLLLFVAFRFGLIQPHTLR